MFSHFTSGASGYRFIGSKLKDLIRSNLTFICLIVFVFGGCSVVVLLCCGVVVLWYCGVVVLCELKIVRGGGY